MTVVASYGMVLCGNSDEFSQRYRGRIEKVKFGVPINEAFAHDIPATLLVLLLKVNKEGFMKKDIWRAPGNQAQVRKLSHVMQHGRLVNIANFSVYTAASVIKKFLSKLPGGIFGVDNEQTLFDSFLDNSDQDKQRQIFYRIFRSLPVPSQHLLVLLFGTFRMVADSADSYNTKMSPNAIAISVAPSLFHSCIHDGRHAKLEDVQRFKLASQVVQFIITSFGHTALFPRECYEFYARITGRTLRIDENYQFTFQYPSNLSSPAFSALAAKCAGAYSLAALHLEPEPLARSSQMPLPPSVSASATAASSPRTALVQRTGSLHRHPLAHTTDHPKRPPAHAAPLDVVDLKQSISWFFSRPEVVYEGEAASSSQDRPSTSGPLTTRLTNRLSSSVGEVLHEASDVEDHYDLEVLRPLTACAGDAGRSLSCLDWVHENQARRMKSRSDWFLSPFIQTKPQSKSIDFVSKIWSTRSRENAPLLTNEILPVVENIEERTTPPKERQPLVDRQNSVKDKDSTGSRRTLTQRLSGSSSVNISGYSCPTVQSTPSTAIARRRSWRMRCSQDEDSGASGKTHSLDAPYPPSELDKAVAKMDDWIKSTGPADGVPPKRRSLKKKHTALF